MVGITFQRKEYLAFFIRKERREGRFKSSQQSNIKNEVRLYYGGILDTILHSRLNCQEKL